MNVWSRMGFIDVADVLAGGVSGEISVRGWINNSRSSGGIRFMLLRDGSGLIQCTVRREAVGEELYGKLEGLPLESALELSGTVREDGRAPGGWELSVSGAGAVYPAKLDYRTSSRSEQSSSSPPGTGSGSTDTPRPRAPAS
jgi:aspartyl/asparaginyl-tRNA synthetase